VRNFATILLKAFVCPCSCTVCGGSLLNIHIEEQQTAFRTEDIPTDCKWSQLFVSYLCCHFKN